MTCVHDPLYGQPNDQAHEQADDQPHEQADAQAQEYRHAHQGDQTRGMVQKPWGWVVIDKKSGVTSMHVTHRIKRIFNMKKAGHAGTLDPLASGILPVALGLATPLIAYAMNFSKTYTFTVAWGAFTATDDICGVVQKTCEKRPSLMQLQEILPRWIGEILQVPPVYCAAKIQGMPAYTRARQGEEVCLAARRVHIHHMEILDHRGDETDFRMTCGTGTYVRSVARDMATVLGMCGFIKALRRVRVGPFHEGMCLGQLEQENPDAVRGIILPPQQVLGGMPSYRVSQSEKMALWDGKKIQLSLLTPLTQNVIACYDESGCLVALANVCQGWLAPTRCFIGTI